MSLKPDPTIAARRATDPLPASPAVERAIADIESAMRAVLAPAAALPAADAADAHELLGRALAVLLRARRASK